MRWLFSLQLNHLRRDGTHLVTLWGSSFVKGDWLDISLKRRQWFHSHSFGHGMLYICMPFCPHHVLSTGWWWWGHNKVTTTLKSLKGHDPCKYGEGRIVKNYPSTCTSSSTILQLASTCSSSSTILQLASTCGSSTILQLASTYSTILIDVIHMLSVEYKCCLNIVFFQLLDGSQQLLDESFFIFASVIHSSSSREYATLHIMESPSYFSNMLQATADHAARHRRFCFSDVINAYYIV